MNNLFHKLLFKTLLGGLIVMSAAAWASNWNAVASTCAVGDAHLERFDVTSATLEIKDGNIGQITARCNVSNPVDSANPTWNTLGVGYKDPDGVESSYRVLVQLKRVNRSTGAVATVATLDSDGFTSTSNNYQTVSFSPTLDFITYAYWINIELETDSTTVSPQVYYLHLATN